MPTPDLALCAVAQLAQYNQWMNERLYAAAATLPADALVADRGAFFGSVLGTLNHLVVGDTLWLQRLATHPALADSHVPALDAVRHWPTPERLDDTVCTHLPDLWQRRQTLDAAVLALSAHLTEADLAQPVSYLNTKKQPHRKQLFSLLLHFFNHQTHHRGQVTTLLHQAGVDMGVTDLIALLPEAG